MFDPNEGPRLYLRILEEPDDDAPRLIYSDWLEESGDDERAKFIRAQLKYARIPGHCTEECNERCHTLRLADLTNICTKIIGHHGYARSKRPCRRCDLHAPLDHAESSHWECLWSRGFVSEVRMTCEAFMGGMCPTCDGCGDVCDAGGAGLIRTMAATHATSFLRYSDDRNCPACRGSGRLLGMAETLFRSHPITRVVLTDRVPYHPAAMFHDGQELHMWLNADPAHSSSHLGPDLFSHLRDGRRENSHRADYLPEEAMPYLSAACVAYGRSKAGLPPLPERKRP